MNSSSGWVGAAMALLFLSDQGGDLLAVVEEVAQGMDDLGFGEVEGGRYLRDRFAQEIEGGHVPNGDAQTVNERLAAANAFPADDVGVLGLDKGRHRNRSLGVLRVTRRRSGTFGRGPPSTSDSPTRNYTEGQNCEEGVGLGK